MANGRGIANGDDNLYGPILQRLVQSGDWDRILSLLRYKLNETGWLDGLRHRLKERAKTMEPLSVPMLLAEFGTDSHTLTSVPDQVRLDIMNAIRQYLEKQFDA